MNLYIDSGFTYVLFSFYNHLHYFGYRCNLLLIDECMNKIFPFISTVFLLRRNINGTSDETADRFRDDSSSNYKFGNSRGPATRPWGAPRSGIFGSKPGGFSTWKDVKDRWGGGISDP